MEKTELEKMEIERRKKQVEQQRKEIQIKHIVEKTLNELGIKITLKGYKCWITGVKIKMFNPDIKTIILYKEIAAKHKTTANRVERALRHSYENISDRVQKYFNLSYKVTNKVLLECLIKRVEMYMEELETVRYETEENVE